MHLKPLWPRPHLPVYQARKRYSVFPVAQAPDPGVTVTCSLSLSHTPPTSLSQFCPLPTSTANPAAPHTPTQIHPRHSSPSGPPKMQAWCTVPSVRPYGQPPYSSPVPLGSSPKPRKWKPGPRSIQHPPSFPPPILLSVPACLPLSSGVCLGLFVILCTLSCYFLSPCFPRAAP